MTSPAIYDLLSRHLDAWYADTGAEGPTLRVHMHNAIQEALAEQDKLWQAGNETLRQERNAARDKLAAVAAGLSFDPAVDRDLETCARRVYHERDDAIRALDNYKAMMHDKGP